MISAPIDGSQFFVKFYFDRISNLQKSGRNNAKNFCIPFN